VSFLEVQEYIQAGRVIAGADFEIIHPEKYLNFMIYPSPGKISFSKGSSQEMTHMIPAKAFRSPGIFCDQGN